MSSDTELKDKLDNFLETPSNTEECQEKDCQGKCVIKGDKSLVERINKKIITEDGRELLV